MVGVAVSGALAATDIWRLIDGGTPPPTGLCLMLAFFVLLFLFFGLLLVSPQTLSAAPNGLTWNTGRRMKLYKWSEVSNFRPMELGALGCDLSGRNPYFGWLRPFNKRTVGSHGSLGFAWEGGSARISEILNAARAR